MLLCALQRLWKNDPCPPLVPYKPYYHFALQSVAGLHFYCKNERQIPPQRMRMIEQLKREVTLFSPVAIPR